MASNRVNEQAAMDAYERLSRRAGELVLNLLARKILKFRVTLWRVLRILAVPKALITCHFACITFAAKRKMNIKSVAMEKH
jgi:hypothetical protein